jgi:NDP-sugar pyrophosphorylase family protein
MKIHLVMPMSGQGVRFQQAGFTQPKPLVPVSGTPMVERLLSTFPKDWPAYFVLAQNHWDTGLRALLQSLRPEAHITSIEPHKQGPGFALLSVLDTLPAGAPVLVTYCDYGMQWDAKAFEAFVETTQCDAAVLSYRGFHPHYLYPEKYAYCRMEGERVVEVKEKGSFTEDREKEYASSGGYYFRTAALLKEALLFQQANALFHGGESYTSLTVEALLQMTQRKADVRVFEISKFFQWGTPRDVHVFEYWERAFKADQAAEPTRLSVKQFLMPMAGFGSRFQEVSPLPKPLIPVDGKPMFRAAAESLPKYDKGNFVYLEKYATPITAHFGA